MHSFVRCSRGCCCSPLCWIPTVFGILLLTAAVASLLISLLISNSSTTSTTSTTDTTTTDTTSATETTSTTESTTTGLCNPACINGGTCTGTNNCLCITDVWTGPSCETPVRILWTFDNNLDDFYGNFPAVSYRGYSYRSPGIDGYGTCLYLNSSLNQYLTILTPPFLNMAYTSFSLSAWVKATTLNKNTVNGRSDSAIFGQFDQNSKDRSLHIIVRNQVIYFGFYSDDTQGSQTLVANTWYHMAYIYDYSTLRQSVYVNGVLDGTNTPRGPYKGRIGNMTIGTNAVFAGLNYWNGCIDRISYFSRAKNATEVLSDATLTVAYDFNSTLLDNGPLGINGTGANYSFTPSGRVFDALELTMNTSYVQAENLVLLGTSGRAYSMVIWINPENVLSGTIIHVESAVPSVNWSMPVMGFNSMGNIVIQSCRASGIVSLSGPSILNNTWTHVAITYGTTTGLRLWINGTQYGVSSSVYSYSTANVPVTITLGASLSSGGLCAGANTIATGQYLGLLDEFELYSRELSSSDVWSLANP